MESETEFSVTSDVKIDPVSKKQLESLVKEVVTVYHKYDDIFQKN